MTAPIGEDRSLMKPGIWISGTSGEPPSRTHLRHAYQKLHIGAREELSQALVRDHA